MDEAVRSYCFGGPPQPSHTRRERLDPLGGVEELVQAYAIDWTKRASGSGSAEPPHQHEVWVWAGAVERA